MAAVKKVAVIGFGNIGVGVVRALYEKGVNSLELVKVVDIDLKTRRPVKVPKTMLSDAWKSVVDDPDIDIIVETIGGIEPAADNHRFQPVFLRHNNRGICHHSDFNSVA